MSEPSSSQSPQEPNQHQPAVPQHGHVGTPAHATPAPSQQPQYQQQYPQQPQYPQQQYPQPYSPYAAPQSNMMAYGGQQHGFNFMGRMLRAAVLLYISGGILAIAGLSCLGLVTAGPWQQIYAQMPMDPALSELTPELFRGVLGTMGGAISLAGIIFIVLGIFVHKGSRGAAIGAIVFTVIVLLLLSCLTISSLVNVGRMQGTGGESMLGICMMIAPFLLMVWQLIWCIQAASAAGSYRAMQAQMQMQYWQYMQMQQQYQQMQMQSQKPEDRSQKTEGGGTGQPPPAGGM